MRQRNGHILETRPREDHERGLARDWPCFSYKHHSRSEKRNVEVCSGFAHGLPLEGLVGQQAGVIPDICSAARGMATKAKRSVAKQSNAHCSSRRRGRTVEARRGSTATSTTPLFREGAVLSRAYRCGLGLRTGLRPDGQPFTASARQRTSVRCLRIRDRRHHRARQLPALGTCCMVGFLRPPTHDAVADRSGLCGT